MSKLLVMFSGGIDSTGALYKALKEYKHLKVYAHHVHLINSKNRYKPEALACKNICNYLRDNGFEFEYDESTVDLSIRYFDPDILFSIAGLIVRSDKLIKYITTGCVSTDVGVMAEPDYMGRLEKVFSEIVSFDGEDRKVENLRVVKHMTKREVWESMPPDLRNLTWSCRLPIEKNGNFFPCSKSQCNPCKLLNKLKIEKS